MLYGLPIPPPPSKVCKDTTQLVLSSDLFQNLIRRNKPPSTTSRTEEPVVSIIKEETQAGNLGYTLPPVCLIHV